MDALLACVGDSTSLTPDPSLIDFSSARVDRSSSDPIISFCVVMVTPPIESIVSIFLCFLKSAAVGRAPMLDSLDAKPFHLPKLPKSPLARLVRCLRARMRKKMKAIMMASRATPPTTAPAIAPAIRLEFDEDEEEATIVGMAVGNEFAKHEKSVPLFTPKGNENAGTNR